MQMRMQMYFVSNQLKINAHMIAESQNFKSTRIRTWSPSQQDSAFPLPLGFTQFVGELWRINGRKYLYADAPQGSYASSLQIEAARCEKPDGGWTLDKLSP